MSQLLDLFDGQGLVFWSAVTAVALGLTMLSVSIYFQSRKLLSGKSLPRFSRPARPAAQTAAASPPPVRISVTDEGYGPELVAAPAPKVATADPLLSSLLERLQTSADRLERIHVSLDQSGTSVRNATESVLKAPAAEVDYVYQAGRA